MIELVGSKNKAIVYVNEELINDETREQIIQMLEDDALENIRVMPDCHKGGSSCVGFTCKLSKVAPNIIGNDIGCGMLCYPIGILKEKKLLNAEKLISYRIPVNHYAEPIVLDRYIDEFCRDISIEHENFIRKYKEKFNVELKKPEFTIDSLCDRLKLAKTNFLNHLGTLGQGNHFIEIDQDESNDEMYITIHSGSRILGDHVCSYYSKLLRDKKEKYLEGDDLYGYLFDMIIAQKYAQLNRRVILHVLLENLGIEFNDSLIIESIHNYIDFNDFVLRKGAIAAHENEKCIVALNMKDGILICRGKGNSEWNWSCAHGAGRLWSRGEVRYHVKLKDFQKEMKDVVSSTVCEETLDECPQAYKNSQLIVQAIAPTAEPLMQLKSILNFKGYTLEEKANNRRRK